MKKVLESEYFVVIDDYLPQEVFQNLWKFFQFETFEFVQQKKWIKVNRLLDGNSLFGPVRFSKKVENSPLEYVYPFSTIIDNFFENINNSFNDIKHVIGEFNVDWNYYTARSYLYPKGSGLSWHNDHYGYTGAYVYYIHPFWNTQWGGELLISDNSGFNLEYQTNDLKGFNNRLLGFHLDNQLENQQLLAKGIGNYILPKPNRIVFIKAGIHHMIKKVDDSAGDNSRCTIAGFFVK